MRKGKIRYIMSYIELLHYIQTICAIILNVLFKIDINLDDHFCIDIGMDSKRFERESYIFFL